MLMKKTERGYIAPENPKDLPLFMHCSEGCIAVSEERFEKFVQPLLFLHGVAYITINLNEPEGAQAQE